MRAKGKDKVKPFKGGTKSQREHLNLLVDDHGELVLDVADLERKQQNWDGILRLIYVDIGEENDEVTFRYADLNGVDAGPVEATA